MIMSDNSDNDHDHDDELEPPPQEYQEFIRKITVTHDKKRSEIDVESGIPEIVDALKLPSTSKTQNSKPSEVLMRSRKMFKEPRKKISPLRLPPPDKTPSVSRSLRKTSKDVDKVLNEVVKKTDKIKSKEISKEVPIHKEVVIKTSEKPLNVPSPNHNRVMSRISRNEFPKTYQKHKERLHKSDDTDDSSSSKEKKSLQSNRSGKFLKTRAIPRPTILTAVPEVAPTKFVEEGEEIINHQDIINCKGSVGFLSASSNSKNRSSQDLSSNGNGNQTKSPKSPRSPKSPKSPGSPNSLPVEELYVDLVPERDGNISDINSAISLMVRQREFIQLGDLDQTASQDSLPSASLHSIIAKTRSMDSAPLTHNQLSTKLFHMNVITKDNFNKVRWSDAYEHLAIKRCVQTITAENISTSRKTLTAIKFVQVTSFLNIKLILENCSNLVRLSFANIAVVNKSHFNPQNQPIIPLPHLEELELQEWLFTLTKYEYWILDFLNKGCSFGKLEKFIFQGRENAMNDKKIGKFQKQLKGLVDPAVVTKFMLKNSTSLKKVSIGGIGFQLMDSATRFANQLGRLQLNSLRLDLQTPGVEFLLLNQRKLQSLSCTGFLYAFEGRTKQWVIQSLDNNYVTLAYLGIFPCIIGDIPADKRHSLYTIDCETFRRCKRLESLFINITTVYRRMHTERFSCGKIVNIHLLPVSLVEIELFAYKYQEQDVDDFCKRLPMFRKLRELVLNSTAPYTLTSVLISNLPLLESLQSAKFNGGKFDDSDTMQRIVRKRNLYSITISEAGVHLVRNESNHQSASPSHRASVSDKKITIK